MSMVLGWDIQPSHLGVILCCAHTFKIFILVYIRYVTCMLCLSNICSQDTQRWCASSWRLARWTQFPETGESPDSSSPAFFLPKLSVHMSGLPSHGSPVISCRMNLLLVLGVQVTHLYFSCSIFLTCHCFLCADGGTRQWMRRCTLVTTMWSPCCKAIMTNTARLLVLITRRALTGAWTACCRPAAHICNI